MRNFLRLPSVPGEPLPPEFAFDVRSSEVLVELLLEEHTREGDVVLDPFAGFGTTLVVAERMGRLPVGVELDPRVAAYARSLLRRPEALIDGDARRLRDYGLPRFDFSLTSPPFMCRGDVEDPLAAYAAPGTGYEAYLRGLQDIYRQVRQLMKADARVVLEVANQKQGGEVTTLAWDVAAAIGEVLHFEGEVVILEGEIAVGCDDDYDHNYCLVFTKGD